MTLVALDNSIPSEPNPLTGDILVAEGLIHSDDIERVLSIQKQNQDAVSGKGQRLFGMVLCDLNLITPMDNYCVLKKHGKLMGLEKALVQANLLSPLQVKSLIDRSRSEGVPFISLLLECKLLSKVVLQQLLFDLFHIPFRSISDIIFSAGLKAELARIITKAEARLHQMIPLVLKDQVLLCGITAPENLAYLKLLDEKFPQYRFQPLFIPFSGFAWFFRLLYGENLQPPGAAAEGETDPPMNFRILISDPMSETDVIQALYQRYEKLRQMDTDPSAGPEDRALMFQTFIQDAYSRISRDQGCSTICFSLRQEASKVSVAAHPCPEGAPWQR